ncbi:MAG: hypothetical protein ACOVVK_15080, partial [Elsteraceae bacterium]
MMDFVNHRGVLVDQSRKLGFLLTRFAPESGDLTQNALRRDVWPSLERDGHQREQRDLPRGEQGLNFHHEKADASQRGYRRDQRKERGFPTHQRRF